MAVVVAFIITSGSYLLLKKKKIVQGDGQWSLLHRSKER